MSTERGYLIERIPNLPEFADSINLYEKKGSNPYLGVGEKIIEAGKFLLGKIGVCKNRKIEYIISQVITDNKIDAVYCQWGITVVPLMAMIKRMFPGLPVIHEILTYPSSTNPLEIAFQNFFYGMLIKKIDGRIHCSRRMYDYLNSRFNLKQQEKDLIRPLYFSESFFYKKRLPLLSDRNGEPHVIFIGRADFSKKRPHSDIREKIKELAKLKIHVWISSKSGNIEKNGYVHFYPWFNLDEVMTGEMATYMTQFDACIYLHNIRRKYAMYENSLQTRFLFSFTAGIPIVMQKGYYRSCQEIIEKNRIGFAYEDIGELKAKLSDKDFMTEYRKNAIKNFPDFTFENNFEKLDQFIREVINRGADAV